MTAPESKPRASLFHDEVVEQLVGNLLRIGVLIAAGVTLIGGIVYLYHNGGAPSGHQVFASEPAELRSVAGIIRGATHLQGQFIVQLGLLILIATPIARVALTLVAFIIQRDRLYVVITAIVLALLLFSLTGGRA